MGLLASHVSSAKSHEGLSDSLRMHQISIFCSGIVKYPAVHIVRATIFWFRQSLMISFSKASASRGKYQKEYPFVEVRGKSLTRYATCALIR